MRVWYVLFFLIFLFLFGCLKSPNVVNVACCSPSLDGDSSSCSQYEMFDENGNPVNLSNLSVVGSYCEGNICYVNFSKGDVLIEKKIPICGSEDFCGKNCSFLLCSPYNEETPIGGGDLVEFVDSYCSSQQQCDLPFLRSMPRVVISKNLIYASCSIERLDNPYEISEFRRYKALPFFVGFGRDLRESVISDYLPFSGKCELNPIGKVEPYVSYYNREAFDSSLSEEIPFLKQPLFNGSGYLCRYDGKEYYSFLNGRRVVFSTFLDCLEFFNITENVYFSTLEGYNLMFPLVGGREFFGITFYPSKDLILSRYGGNKLDGNISPVGFSLDDGGRFFEGVFSKTVDELSFKGIKIGYSDLKDIEQLLSNYDVVFIFVKNNVSNSIRHGLYIQSTEDEIREEINNPSTYYDVPNVNDSEYIRYDSNSDGSFFVFKFNNDHAVVYEKRVQNNKLLKGPLYNLFDKLNEDKVVVFVFDDGDLYQQPGREADAAMFGLGELYRKFGSSYSFYLVPSFADVANALPYAFYSLNSISFDVFNSTSSEVFDADVDVNYSYTKLFDVQSKLCYGGECSYRFEFECSSPLDCKSGYCDFSNYSRVVLFVNDSGEIKAVSDSYCFSFFGKLYCSYGRSEGENYKGDLKDVKFSTFDGLLPIPTLSFEYLMFDKGKWSSGLAKGWGLVVRPSTVKSSKYKNIKLGEEVKKVLILYPPTALDEGLVYPYTSNFDELPVINYVTYDFPAGDSSISVKLSAAFPIAKSSDSYRIGNVDYRYVCSSDLNRDKEKLLFGKYVSDKDSGFEFVNYIGRTVGVVCGGKINGNSEDVCSLISGYGAPNKCGIYGSKRKFFSFYRGLKLWHELVRGLERYPIFQVCGMEKEFVLCANPVFRDPRLSLVKSWESDRNEIFVPLSYSPLDKTILNNYNLRVNVKYLAGKSNVDEDENEAKMLVLSYNGVSEEEAANICSQLSISDFCLSGFCKVSPPPYGRMAPAALVVFDYNNDGKVGKYCVFDNNTVLSYESYGFCRGCSLSNSKMVVLDKLDEISLPSYRGVVGYDGKLYTKFDGDPYVPTDRVDEVIAYPTGDYDFPSVYPSFGLGKERIRDWLSRGNIVFVRLNNFDDDTLENVSVYFKDLLVRNGNVTAIPIGALNVVVDKNVADVNLFRKLRKLCPTCMFSLYIDESEFEDLYNIFGLQQGERCERRGLTGKICKGIYPYLSSLIVGYKFNIDGCSYTYQQIDEVIERANESAKVFGLPTVVFIESLSVNGADEEGYIVCNGEKKAALENFFDYLSYKKEEMINAGVWGIYFEDLSIPPNRPEFSLFTYDFSNNTPYGAYKPRKGYISAVDKFLVDMTFLSNEYVKNATVGDCDGCISPSLCLNQNYVVKCSDGTSYTVEELWEEAQASYLAKYKIASLFKNSGFTVCGNETGVFDGSISSNQMNLFSYIIERNSWIRPYTFSFCEEGDIECQSTNSSFLTLVNKVPGVECYAERV